MIVLDIAGDTRKTLKRERGGKYKKAKKVKQRQYVCLLFMEECIYCFKHSLEKPNSYHYICITVFLFCRLFEMQ